MTIEELEKELVKLKLQKKQLEECICEECAAPKCSKCGKPVVKKVSPWTEPYKPWKPYNPTYPRLWDDWIVYTTGDTKKDFIG